MINTASGATDPIGMFEQPVLPIANPQAYGAVRTAIESAFANSRVASFLSSLASIRARIRDFETVLGRGLLGETARADYAKLENGEQGQIREYYLASLERVTPELRQRFFRLYSYY